MSSKKLSAGGETRVFQITVTPDLDAFGITLYELNGATTIVARANRKRMRDLSSCAAQAVKDSGQARTALHSGRKSPITLKEEAGVRLALGLFTTEGVRKGARKTKMLAGVQDMAAEEAYYWYAKCVGSDAQRVRRALRLFLAEE